jgi:sugar phosphate isomerase/epimerase
MGSHFNRRQMLIASGSIMATAFTSAALTKPVFASETRPRKQLLGFSLYGMRSLSLADGLRHCAEIGYRAVELPVLADWPADSAKFTAVDQKNFRDGLEKNSLRLSAIMENLPLLGDEAKQRSNLERLKAAAELAKNLVPNDYTLIETVLGGKPAQWEDVKQQIVDRLGDWLKVMADAGVRLAIKAHIANAIQTPQQLRWVLDRLDNEWLTAAFDYSHFELQKLTIEESLKPFLNRGRPIHFVHVKDAQGEPGKFQFLLPGEGKTNYDELFSTLAKGQYRGDVVVEVSGQIFSKPDYDPLAAARKSFAALAPAMKQFGEPTP